MFKGKITLTYLIKISVGNRLKTLVMTLKDSHIFPRKLQSSITNTTTFSTSSQMTFTVIIVFLIT